MHLQSHKSLPCLERNGDDGTDLKLDSPPIPIQMIVVHKNYSMTRLRTKVLLYNDIPQYITMSDRNSKLKICRLPTRINYFQT